MSKLEPADLTRCQAERVDNFMVIGGNYKPHRCTNTPTVLVTEKKKGADGRRGSMSLCDSCLEVFRRRMPKDYATEKKISELKATVKKKKEKPDLDKTDIKVLTSLMRGGQFLKHAAHSRRALEMEKKGYVVNNLKLYRLAHSGAGQNFTYKTYTYITKRGTAALKKAAT